MQSGISMIIPHKENIMSKIKYLSVKLINTYSFDFDEELDIKCMWDKLKQTISNTDIKARLMLHDDDDKSHFVYIEFAAKDSINRKIIEIRQHIYDTINTLICTGSIISEQWCISEQEHDIEDNTDGKWTFGVIELNSVTK